MSNIINCLHTIRCYMSRDQIKVAEIFYSIQGEGKWAGVPSVFLRTFGCNFECRSFGLPRGERTTEPEEVAERIEEFKVYEELPLVSTGCDSYASWHPKFKHMSPLMSIDEIANKMHELIPNNTWTQPGGDDIHLILTGGEPLLGWQKAYPELLLKCMKNGLRNITIETNGTQKIDPLLSGFFFHQFTKQDKLHHKLTFSVSPKLSVSGESWDKAIKPDIINSYQQYGYTYLKFVVATEEDVEEVEQATLEYRKAGFTGYVYLMPVGGVYDQYAMNSTKVAELAMKKGYRYSPRLQVDLYKNAWGT